MKYTQAKQGRIFIIRLEDGEIIHEVIESFARQESIRSAVLIALGGADGGSRLVVGPEEDRALPVEPMTHVLDNAHEIVGTGTLFPDEKGNPVLHMHAALRSQGPNRYGLHSCGRPGSGASSR